ncbi:MAG: phosphate ABC transporter ATP-binding protein [Pseudomonadota bacterium]
MPSEAKIALENLNIRYGKTEALKGVSMEIRANEIFTIIGPANSGKTTLLLAINRMIERSPDVSVEGQVLLDGYSVTEIRDLQQLRRRVGLVFALPIPLPMSIRDNVLFGVKMKQKLSREDADLVVEKSLRDAFLWEEVKDRLESSALRLSGGQQQRLCIARTLAVRPEVVMFDEPCSGLDPISTAQVESAMRELKARHTLILVTNNTKQAARVGDRTAFLLMGELVEVDRTEKMFTSASDPRTEAFLTGKFG